MLKTAVNSIQNLEYVVMPGKVSPGFRALELHNETYNLWRNVWKDVFTEAGNPTALVADDFLRQDFICTLHRNGEVVACHLYTIFNMEQNVSLDHRYFSIFPKNIIDLFRAKKATHLMSMEFLTVHPEWRKNSTAGMSLGPILTHLGVNVFRTLNMDAAIAPARKKMKVEQMAAKFGFECLQPNVSRGNLDCDLIALFPQNIKTYPEEIVVDAAEILWANKLDLTGRLGDSMKIKKSA